MTDLLSIFRGEVEEYLEALNTMLLQIEMLKDGDPNYRAALVEMNRIAHSMKGAARAVGIGSIESLAHYMEEIFGAALKQHLQLTPIVCDALYDSLDMIQMVMAGDDPDEAVFSDTVSGLEQIVASTLLHDSAATARDNGAHEPETATDETLPAVAASPTDEHAPILPELPEIPHIDDVPVPPIGVTPPAHDASALRPQSDEALTRAAALDSQTIAMRPIEETVRITVSKLDRLMGEATELIVARMRGEERQRDLLELRRSLTRWQREWRSVRSAYIRLVRRLQERQIDSGELPILFKFLESNQRYLQETNRALLQLAQAVAQDNLHLTTLSDQLQEDIDGMRLVPFDSTAALFQRVVRDLARDIDKVVQFDISGAHVEIDKTVLDALKDPLMHLLRNAVDHGIEPADVRVQSGKAGYGRVTLAVEQRGSEIVIRVSDDGRGVDPARVRRAIVRARLLSQAEADALSNDEARFYVFQAGLSTNEAVTTISGRGYGMDIVRERVEGLRGRVNIESQVGVGTTVTLNVPVSLTRIRCILLELGEAWYAIPSAVVGRMLTLSRESVFTAEGRDMVVIGGQPVPLVALSTVLRVPGSAGDDERVHVLLLHSGSKSIAFEVDELLSEQELVLKPLGRELARAPLIAGAALLGTGSVVIVLDANDLVRAASGSVLPRKRAAVEAVPKQRRVQVLVVDDSITTRTLEKNILETAGFDVSVAIDGVEAWSMIADHDFDVVISDVEMPNMNGLDLTVAIKNHPHYSHLPVILLTSLGKPEQREAGLRAGADAYLIKSQFDQGELLNLIQSVL
jgi:two-component system chemotaxis sensor kinase CheA